ncbi:MAG: hypothetical protein K2O16_10480 [Lachnospiraceae bacterium]|nr:hypothetical protein [Lachnospiraceae bacterium]
MEAAVKKIYAETLEQQQTADRGKTGCNGWAKAGEERKGERFQRSL